MTPAVTVLLGVLLGAGVLLSASSVLWPVAANGSQRRLIRADDLVARLAGAGLGGVPPLALAALSTLLGLIVGAATLAVVGVAVIAVVTGTSAFCIPAAVLLRRERRRRTATRTAWPDVVDHLVSGARAGLALPDAVAALARSGPQPTRAAFAGFEQDYRAGGDFGRSLDALKDRIADPVGDRLFETLRMARDVGGSDLVEILRGLSAYLREDAALRAELRARQSWVVGAARLGVVAPWIVLLLLSTRPEGAAAYNAPLGTLVIVVGAVLSVVAYLLMLRIGRLPEEKRWFR